MLLTLAEIKLNFSENDASVDAQLGGGRLVEVTVTGGWWLDSCLAVGSACK